MKTMSCSQLGGACEETFRAKTFEEIAEMSKRHGMEMYQKGDEKHLKAMAKMQELMKSQEIMNDWLENKRKEFEDLPEEE
ncbi:MAG: DUF1059 domain-containing protein [Stygiobacter sp. RIFOXYC12_FULL_38_8]|nr:MAG: DUF1059 domain-containing protein [Stygiobacter sp. GWC2_38_9]OGV08961.1 MAG: DUF1059 domain-containing protein [Stygiobacter sp. RIFOXYB2_FULL_37_11]OGV11237.1 MAG: DUF1059 domain-containing protein [Stygiobacter sp. RIFOXYA2_FULL_38_8]OGV12106.1 MAG: DUF1059 domain-containing protein [Stygiobacter sp. RIFOXYC2_FULL_38_25]OGV26517.1 MAG: DUF1059 domain-containing protein [Stygiobacter sp. RIFOXYC12_FULL_38_8]OGV81232.1 MAG: DUF1059 domain-containing protein [Stygiobacter sp. GWF2_38_2